MISIEDGAGWLGVRNLEVQGKALRLRYARAHSSNTDRVVLSG